MSFFRHSFDCVRPSGSLVNSTFAVVVPADEEGGVCICLLQKVKKLFGVLGWPIIVGESYYLWQATIGDDAPVRDITGETSIVRGGIVSSRRCIRVTAAELALAGIWNSTVFLASSLS